MVNELNGRPCIVHGKEQRLGVFRGFSDNNDKCIIEFKDGELHKVYVWSVQFLDTKKSIEDVLDLICDINVKEICSHIENDNLQKWIDSWKQAILEGMGGLYL